MRLPPLLSSAVLCLTTLSVPAQHGTPVEATHSEAASVAVTRPPLMPDATTSFGACRVGGWLYVYGGHIGRAHAHSKDNVIGSFRRLNLLDGHSWQELPPGPALQGTALVAADDGSIYRVGGTDARNERGEDEDMHSTNSVARFDPASGRWQRMTPLPEPRSSHDAIVCDGRLYVIGGWNLQGPGDGDWHRTAWVADLRQQPLAWQPLPPLGDERRACAVATFAGKVAVLGGITPDRGTIRSVRVFDPASDTWSDAPDLPGFAFGTAALGVDGALYATVLEGSLLRWHGGDAWQHVAQLETPRFFHRMVPAVEAGHVLACGGAGRGGHMRTIETLALDSAQDLAIREYVIPAPSRVTHRQALLLDDNVLWALGGNRGLPGDRFAPQQFADDVWKIELTTMQATLSGRLPHAAQSMAVASFGERRAHAVVGGLGVVDGEVRTLDQAYRWDVRRRKAAYYDDGGGVPGKRTQAQLVHHDGRLLLLGGVDFTPAADGGTIGGDTRDVLALDPDAAAGCVATGMRLPRPRRSFGAAVLGQRLYLIGGLGEGFAHAGPCDVYDFTTGQWSELAAPTEWVSPQVAVIGDRLYVACGGRMKGQRFREDRSLVSFSPEEGWRTVVDELPFPVRHVQMLAQRNRLLFYAANDPRGDRIVVRTLQPDASVRVLEASMHR